MKVKKFFVFSILFMFVFMCVFAVDGMHYAQAESKGELVAHYTFDGDLKDSSGKGNHGTAEGNITFDEGKIGKAARFNGSSYIEVKGSDSLDLTDGFTFAMWLNKEEVKSNLPYTPILNKGGSVLSPYRLDLVLGHRTPGVSLVDESRSSSNEFRSDNINISNRWTHLSATWDGEKTRFYIDGDFKGSVKTEGTDFLKCNDEDLIIGMITVQSTAIYKGRMDDLRIYNYALPASDISELVKAKPPAETQAETPKETEKPKEAEKPKETEPVAQQEAKPPADLSKGLVAYYPFEGNCNDLSGNNNHGTEEGKFTFADGKVGKAAIFDGSSYIEVKDSSSLDLTDGLTFSVWVYREEVKPKLPYTPILNKGGNVLSPYRFDLILGHRTPGVSLVDESRSWSKSYSAHKIVVDTKNWTHVAVTWDGIRIKFYENGALGGLKETTDVDFLRSNDEELIIGMITEQSRAIYDGMMDELRIYNRALSYEEIKLLYDGKPLASTQTETTAQQITPAAVVSDGLIAYYPFEGNCNDFSGKNNHGNAEGNLTFVDAKVGKGAKFDGASYIDIKDSDSLDLTDGLTFGMWIYREEDPTNSPYTTILCKDESYSDLPYRFILEYGHRRPGVSLRDESSSSYESFSSNIVVDIKKWTHVAVTWDGSILKFYENGNSADSIETERVGSLYCNNQNLLIGILAADSTVFFNGMMDELRIYNRALSDGEVKLLYDAKASGVKPQEVSDISDMLSDIVPVLEDGKIPAITVILQLDNPKMYVNGVEKDIDPGYGTKPIIIEGRTVLPVRAIMESLGGNVGWVQNEKKITIDLGDSNISMWLNKKDYYVNGVKHTLDVAPVSINSRTLLPLRPVLENLGYTVHWNNALKAVIIVSPN